MFIREVTKKVKGKKYIQHQLIESLRTPAGPRQKLILNLGLISLHKDKWKALANLIENQLHNQVLFFEEDPEVESLAKQYVKRIRSDRLLCEREKKHDADSADKETEYEKVNLNSVCNSDSKSVGAEHVILNQMKDYGFDNILKKLDFDDNQIIYAKLLIVARLSHPASEKESVRWIKENSAVLEFFERKKIQVYDNALHRTAIKLWKNHNVIEEELAEVARKSFSLKETVILYDLTNTYFSGSKKNSQIAKHGGKSKERRNDRPLVTLALTVDEEGFPKQSKIYEGNVSEPSTLENVLEKLSQKKDLFSLEKTIVIDAGIASDENINLIKEKGFKYIAVSRKRTYEKTLWDESTEEEIDLSDDKNKLKIKLATIEKEAFLLCHSEIKKEKEEAIFNRRMKSFEEGLREINGKLKKKHTQKKYEKIIERIGRLKEKYKVGNLYEIEIEKKEQNVVNIKFTKNHNGKNKEETFGNYVLRTNRLDLSGEEISQIHRSLTRIEECFKGMKAIGLRPNHHQTDKAVSAHINITVLGYHILCGVLKKLKTAEIHESWKSIRNILETHRRETITMNTEDDKVINIRSCTTPTEKQYKIYHTLEIKQTPIKKIKTKISIKKKVN